MGAHARRAAAAAVVLPVSEADQLARLRVACATGRLPADLGAWAVERLAEVLPARDLEAARNDRLRRAALLVGGSTWARARVLRAALVSKHATVPEQVRRLVDEAHALDPACPRSLRQLVRLLA